MISADHRMKGFIYQNCYPDTKPFTT